jgi:hypothetical protein
LAASGAPKARSTSARRDLNGSMPLHAAARASAIQNAATSRTHDKKINDDLRGERRGRDLGVFISWMLTHSPAGLQTRLVSVVLQEYERIESILILY